MADSVKTLAEAKKARQKAWEKRDKTPTTITFVGGMSGCGCPEIGVEFTKGKPAKVPKWFAEEKLRTHPKDWSAGTSAKTSKT